MFKKMAMVFLIAISLNGLAANLDEGRWVPENKEILSKSRKLCGIRLGLHINLSRYTRKFI